MVVITEEFDSKHRGWGIGALGAITACGAGLAALLFGFVDVLPGGWRSLYRRGADPAAHARLVAALDARDGPLPRPRARARLGALAQHADARAGDRACCAAYPRRLLALAGAAFLFGLAISPAMFFTPKYLQDAHGWTPGWVALLTFGGGFFGIIGNPLAGWLSDRFGRRPITGIFLVAGLPRRVAFYAQRRAGRRTSSGCCCSSAAWARR